ncbi:hydrogenase formation protein HypD [bacterium]|nr:hydrogenase formation protein HypD [bacterium]
MKYIDEYRCPRKIKNLTDAVKDIVTKPWKIMEVCGGQTHAIMRYGLETLLPDFITLLHGPGCPVCVTSQEIIDKAIETAAEKDVIFCSFGDMLRVPGTKKDLLSVKAEGGDVRIVYSPLNAVKLAKLNPGRIVVFFAIGFETTAPANAMSVIQADRLKLNNFKLLTSQVLIPPAIEAILSPPNTAVNGMLAPGHVCTVTGYENYENIARKYEIPIVVTGFEPVDILSGILKCVEMLEKGDNRAANQYARSVRREGNLKAQQIISDVFQVTDYKWRGIGMIPDSGLKLKAKYSKFDAEEFFGAVELNDDTNDRCISGLILQGVKKPDQCPEFAVNCTPENPLGATMVSSEGACAAYYKYRKSRL